MSFPRIVMRKGIIFSYKTLQCRVSSHHVDIHSFEQIIQVNKSLISTLGDSPDVPRVLVGTHRDLHETRQVKYSDAQHLADSWGVPYLECSSKTGENVADVFHTLLKEIEKDDGLLAEAGEGGCSIL